MKQYAVVKLLTGCLNNLFVHVLEMLSITTKTSNNVIFRVIPHEKGRPPTTQIETDPKILALLM